MGKYFRDEEHPWIKGLDLIDISPEALLELVGSASSAKGAPPAWVFDLDSTLFCVGPRIRSIFLEFLRHHPQPRLEWHQVLPRLSPSIQRYDIERTFRDILSDWNSFEAPRLAAELWTEFRDFWSARFFSGRHMHFDEAYPGAVDFVREVLGRGFEVVYLTARDVPRTAQGTENALRQAGFPLGGRAHLLMKPVAGESDLSFKHRATSILRSRFEVKVFVDNEPENLEMAARAFPAAEIVLFHTVMSERVPEGDYRSLLGEREALRLTTYSLGQQ